MAHLFRRGKRWSWEGKINGKRHREATGEQDKDKATLIMERRVRELRGKEMPELPDILLLDIETAPAEGYIWTYWPNYIDPISQVVKNPDGTPRDWSILTYAAKWLFGSKIYDGKVSHKDAMLRRDKSLMSNLWNLFEKSDVIIAHNGDKFDIRRCNYRFAINGFGPPSPYQTIDTIKVAKKAFGAPSYKQDYLNRAFGLKRKIDTDFELWERCVTGDKKALNEMLEYNRGDIGGLEELYMKIRPWIRGPVNLSMYGENKRKQCHNCFGEDLKLLDKPYTTPANQYAAYRCLKCGAIGRDRYTIKTTQQRRDSILPTAR